MKMTDFVKTLAEKNNITQAKAEAMFKSVMDSLFDAVEEDGSLRTSYGTFNLVNTAPRAAREGHNPKTGEKIKIAAQPAKKKVTFKMSKSYKEDLNS